MEYLKDKEFLNKIYTFPIRELFAKIIIMDWLERPIETVKGVFVRGGNLNLDGGSAMRRNGNINVFIDKKNFPQIKGLKTLFALNKKIEIQIGIKNPTNEYKDFPILWFPQGVFITSNISFSHSNSGLDMSIQLRDKMCLLSGECGGTIPASTQFDKYDTLDVNGAPIIGKPVISQIIREAVNHIGKEQLGKIIIEDLDNKIKTVMRWMGETPLYLINQDGSYSITTDFTIAQGKQYQKFEKGDDVGFIYSDFTYPEELVEGAGSSVVTVLDRLKDTLGNYDYYYDVDGNFRFKEIKNYLNTRHSTVELEKMKKENYIVDFSKGKVEYDFEGSPLILSYSNNPQYSMIKNDFIVWGLEKKTGENTFPIRYHLAIDNKPTTGRIYEVVIYEDLKDKSLKLGIPKKYKAKQDFPIVGVDNVYYYDESVSTVFKWNTELKAYVSVEGEEIVYYPSIQNFIKPGDVKKRYIDSSTGINYKWQKDLSTAENKEKQKNIDQIRKDNNDINKELQDDILKQSLNIGKYTKEISKQEEKIKTTGKKLVYAEEQLKMAEEMTIHEKALLDNLKTQEKDITESIEFAMENLSFNKSCTYDYLDGLGESRDFKNPLGRYGTHDGNIDLWEYPYYGEWHSGEEHTLENGETLIYDSNSDTFILIPTTDKTGASLTLEQAKAQYYNTHSRFGIFNTEEEGRKYEKELLRIFKILQGAVWLSDFLENPPFYRMWYIRIPEQENEIITLTMAKEEIVRKKDRQNNDYNKTNNNQIKISNEVSAYKKEIENSNIIIQDLKKNVEDIQNKISQNTEAIKINNNAAERNVFKIQESMYNFVPIEKETLDKIQTNDWRSELFLQGAEAEILGTESNYYYPELKAEWLKIYDLKKDSYINAQGEKIYIGGWKDEYQQHPETIGYFLDFIDTNSEVGTLSVNNIGRRTQVVNSNKINCIFESDIPDIIIIKKGQEDTEEKRKEAEDRGQRYVQVDESIYDMLAIGGLQNSAFNEIKNMLNNSLSFNNTIQMTTLPIYDLDVNTLIKVRDIDSDIYGNYLITNINYPLDINSNMNISAKKMIEKI